MNLITVAFLPFMETLSFTMDSTTISGKLYSASFSSVNHVVKISYEPGDNKHTVIVFQNNNGQLSDIDDRQRTLRLTDLNRQYMPAITDEERLRNEFSFSSIRTQDDEERELLKKAKELCLVLPVFLSNLKV